MCELHTCLDLMLTFHLEQAPADGTFTYVNGDATGAGFSMFYDFNPDTDLMKPVTGRSPP